MAFSGPAKVFESQEAAVEGILGGKVEAGDVVLIRYEGPAAVPACRDAVPDQLPQGQGPRPGLRPGHRRAVLRRHLGLSICHAAPEAAAAG